MFIGTSFASQWVGGARPRVGTPLSEGTSCRTVVHLIVQDVRMRPCVRTVYYLSAVVTRVHGPGSRSSTRFRPSHRRRPPTHETYTVNVPSLGTHHGTQSCPRVGIFRLVSDRIVCQEVHQCYVWSVSLHTLPCNGRSLSRVLKDTRAPTAHFYRRSFRVSCLLSGTPWRERISGKCFHDRNAQGRK